MLYLPHDFHFHINFLIENAILHESSLLQLFSCVGDTVELRGEFEHNRKSSFTNSANLVVF